MEFTDAWAGEKFAESNEGIARWVPSWKKWILWNGKVWEEDGSSGILNLAVKWVRNQKSLRIKNPQLDSEKKFNERLLSWMGSSESVRKLQAMVEFSKSMMTTKVTELDRHLWKMNFQNCVYDFKSGKKYKHDPKFFMTKISPLNLTEGSSCKKYLKFLDEIMLSREDLIEYLQKIFGSCMVGETLERAFYIWCGSGMNGKTTLANLWMSALGPDYAVKLPFHTFTKSRFDDGRGPTPDLHRLRGARIAVASEGEEEQRLATSRLKELTGKSQISVNPKNKEQYEFTPQATYILDTNRIPKFDSTDLAIMDRLKIVPFDFRIDPSNVNFNLSSILEEELPGILEWGVRGCQLWIEQGMSKLPESISIAIELQKQENDPVGIFLSSSAVEGDEKAEVGTKELYDAFIKFAEEAGIPMMKCENFRKRMKVIPRFVNGIKIERLERIFGTKGGGYQGLKIVESEVSEIKKKEKIFKQENIDFSDDL